MNRGRLAFRLGGSDWGGRQARRLAAKAPRPPAPSSRPAQPPPCANGPLPARAEPSGDRPRLGDEPLLTSAIQVYEVYKVVRRDISEERVIESISALHATLIESLAESLALEAADIALEHGLAMADAIIFATARKHDAEIVTANSDFDGLPGVTLIR